MMNFTNATNGDLIGAFGQGLSPISTNVIGISTSTQWVLGIIILLMLVGIMVVRRASLELMAVVLFFGTWGLTAYGLLPQLVFWAMMFICAGLVALAYLKWRSR